MKEDRLTKILVAVFGLYQAGHLLSNLRGAFVFFGRGEMPFPALPPPDGFDPQLVSAYLDMAVMDSLVAVISLIFVWGYFTGQPWRLWLGSMTLTLSFYAGILFNLTALQAGAWTGDNRIIYLLINIGYLPVLVLWVQVMRWSFKYLRE